MVGRAGMDLAPDPAGTGIDRAVTFLATLGGSAANIAVGIARLGGEVDLFSSVSADPVGDFCLNQLADHGVGTSLVFRSSGEARTSLALTEARMAYHRTVIYRNNAADFQITAAQADAIDLAGITTVVVTGTALAIDPSRSAVQALLARAGEAGVQAVLDIDYRPYSWTSPQDAAETLKRAAGHCAIVTGNEQEFDTLAGRHGGGLELAARLAGADGRICIYKRGEQGATTFHAGHRIDTGTWPAAPLKPTGAGDGFLAAFLTACNGGVALRDAILRGSAAAAMVVSRPGCAPAMPTARELDDFIAANQQP
ncbi:MAG: PfkB family carbohydrate kinase [Rhizobiaceae bacterium]